MTILKNNRCERDHTVVCQSSDSRHKVPKIPGALTVSDAILVENDMVFNCLVDQTRMDSTILVRDEQDCKRYIDSTNGLDGFNDRRIRSALTLKGTKIEFRGGNMVKLKFFFHLMNIFKKNYFYFFEIYNDVFNKEEFHRKCYIRHEKNSYLAEIL